MIRKPVRELILRHRMKPGQKGVVVSFSEPGDSAIRRLMVLGFLPGEIFVLERSRPDYLIRFGYTRLAINKRVASMILVNKMTGTMVNR
ncbi:MAG: FeoA family protein [Dethiobacteria bacterium]